MPLSNEEQQEINRLVRQFEQETGVQALAAVIGRADAYPELAWKAYALGSALGALSVLVVPFLITDWSVAYTIAVQAMAVLGAGATLAAGAAFLPALGRLFLDPLRAQAEARQYALTLFVDREIFRTRDRRAVLVLASRFERTVVILPDSGIAAYVPGPDLERLAQEMRRLLIQGRVTAAFELVFARMRAILAERGFVASPPSGDEVPDEVVAEKGA